MLNLLTTVYNLLTHTANLHYADSCPCVNHRNPISVTKLFCLCQVYLHRVPNLCMYAYYIYSVLLKHAPLIFVQKTLTQIFKLTKVRKNEQSKRKLTN